MIRELVIEVASSLPETATFEEIIDAIYMRLRIENGLDAVENRDVLTEEEVWRKLKNDNHLN